jgi:hypothetical protein
VNVLYALRSGSSIRLVTDYYFKAVDVDDIALQNNKSAMRSSEHHYTDAFGDDAKLEGKVDCLVIDIEKYLDEMRSRVQIPKDHL